MINSTTKVNLIPFIFDCDYDLCLLNLTNMPAFYFDILKAQTEVQRQCTKITLEVLSGGITGEILL